MSANRKGCLPALIYMILILGILLAFVLSSQYNADDVYTDESRDVQSETSADAQHA